MDCNCRCCVSQIPRWAVNIPLSKLDNANPFKEDDSINLIDGNNYDEYKKNYFEYLNNIENDDTIEDNFKRLSEDDYFELQEIHRKNINESIRNSIYKTDWDNMRELNKYGYINSNYSGDINILKRTGSIDRNEKEYKKVIQNLEDAIARNKIEDNIQVTRFLDLDYLKDKLDKNTYKEVRYSNKYDNLIKELTGTTVFDNQFISASINEEFNVYNNRKIKMVIDARAGTNAFITENKMEREIIFDSSNLKIKNIELSENNQIVIKVEIEGEK